MKLTIENLEKAKDLASQRVHLHRELAKLNTRGQMTFAKAKIVIAPYGAAKMPDVTVEIQEHKNGDIGAAILDCIRKNIEMRIELLDEALGELGIEIEDAA